MIIFNLAQTLDDGNKPGAVNFHMEQVDDIYYENRGINKLIDANNTQSFNEAVFECV